MSERLRDRRTDRPTDHRGRYLPDGSWPPGRGAPEPLERARRFMNTSNTENGADHFETPASLRAWLEREGYDRPPAVTEAERQQAVMLRAALRELARANHDGTPTEGTLAALDHVAARIPLTIRFAGGPELHSPAAGADAALATVLAAVYDAMVAGTWVRLKSCRNAHCRWAFYDRSKNGSGAWCSTLACGSRMKVRAYRARQRELQAGADRRRDP
jgi:predicted RNA-binding Zn ribbon-like protein